MFRQLLKTLGRAVLVFLLPCGAYFWAVAAGGPPMPPPNNLRAFVQCPNVVLQWNPPGPVIGYEVQVFTGGALYRDQRVTDPTLTLIAPPAGDYSFQVKAFAAPGPFGDSNYSMPFSFTVGVCQSCHLPVVQMISATPNVLWPPNGKNVAVTFSGMVTTDCPLSLLSYTLTDTQGSGQSGTAVLSSGGSLKLMLNLQAARSGDQPEGRIYTLGVQATNPAGTGNGAPLTVTVPHDQGH